MNDSPASSIELNGSRLQRNGTGIRQVGSSSVYSAGLYLNQPASTMEQTLLVPGPKRLSLVMLRDTSSDELGLTRQTLAVLFRF